jgi:ABC-type polysaccharide/polyol phosphate transport system ATPase subunit
VQKDCHGGDNAGQFQIIWHGALLLLIDEWLGLSDSTFEREALNNFEREALNARSALFFVI